MNYSGIVVVLVMILNIWFGHIWVRFLVRRKKRGVFIFPLLLGLLLLFFSMMVEDDVVSVIVAIVSASLLWGSYEIIHLSKNK